jgi:hypothetical protein
MTSFASKALIFWTLASSLQRSVAVDSGLCAEQKGCIHPAAGACTPEGKRIVCITRLHGIDDGCPGGGPSDMPSDVCSWTSEDGVGVVDFNWGVGWSKKYCFEVENDKEVWFYMRGDRACDGSATIDMKWSSGYQHGTARCHPAYGNLCQPKNFPETYYQDNAYRYAEPFDWKTNADGQYKPTYPDLPNGCVWRVKVVACPVPEVPKVRTCTDLDTGIHCPGCYEVRAYVCCLFVCCLLRLTLLRSSYLLVLIHRPKCIRTCCLSPRV